MNNQRWKYKRKNKNDIDRYFSDLVNFISDIYNQAKDLPDGISRLDQLADNPDFDRLAKEAANKIVMYQANSNARTWREAANKSNRGKIIYNYLKKELNQSKPFNDLIDLSATYIKTLPSSYISR